MIKYEDITLEQIDYIKNTDLICDGDKKQIILIERSEKNE